MDTSYIFSSYCGYSKTFKLAQRVPWACNYDSIRAALTQTACGRNEKHLRSSLLALATPTLWKAAYGQTVKGVPEENPRKSNKEKEAGCSARE